MPKKEPTPNYDLMFESVVRALQVSYGHYKEARYNVLRWTFFDNNGMFCFLDGYKERLERVEELEKEIERLMKEVERLRGLKGGAK